MNNFWWTLIFWTGLSMYVFYKWDTRTPIKKRRKRK